MSESFQCSSRSRLKKSLSFYSSIGYIVGVVVTLLVMDLSSQSDSWRDLNAFLGHDADVKSDFLYSAFISGLLCIAIFILFRPSSRFESDGNLFAVHSSLLMFALFSDYLDVPFEDSVWESVQEESTISDQMTQRRLPKLSIWSILGAGLTLLMNFFVILNFSYLESFIVPFLHYRWLWPMDRSVLAFVGWTIVCLASLSVSLMLSHRLTDFMLMFFGFTCGAIGSWLMYAYGFSQVIFFFPAVVFSTFAYMIVNASIVPQYSKILGPGPQKLRILLFHLVVLLARLVGPFLAISQINTELSNIRLETSAEMVLHWTYKGWFVMYLTCLGVMILFFKCLSPHRSLIDHLSIAKSHASRELLEQFKEDSRTPIILLPHSLPGLVLDREFSFIHTPKSDLSVNSTATA
jgi:MFS family permease